VLSISVIEISTNEQKEDLRDDLGVFVFESE
jgi:hypothetical protein